MKIALYMFICGILGFIFGGAIALGVYVLVYAISKAILLSLILSGIATMACVVLGSRKLATKIYWLMF